MTTNSLNIKQFPVWVINIRVQMLSFSYIAYPLPVIVRGICLFDNFEKLLMLLGLSRDILEGWARGYCVHVFLVNSIISITAVKTRIRRPPSNKCPLQISPPLS